MWVHILTLCFGPPQIHLQLGSVFLVVQENRRSCAILATELGNLGISLPKKKGWIQDGFFHYKNGRAGISTNLKKVTMKVVYKEE